jgi:hypothetical protein
MGYSALGAPLRCGWHTPALVIMVVCMRQVRCKMPLREISALHLEARKPAENQDMTETALVERINHLHSRQVESCCCFVDQIRPFFSEKFNLGR